MKLILDIIVIIDLVVLAVALWQIWQIMKKGNEDEQLSEEEANSLTTWLTVDRTCLLIGVLATVLDWVLPLFTN